MHRPHPTRAPFLAALTLVTVAALVPRSAAAEPRARAGLEHGLAASVSAGGAGLAVVCLLVGLVREQRRRRRTEADLATSRALLRAVVEGTSDAVFVKDAGGTYVLVNSAAADLVGKPVEDVTGGSDRAFFSPETARALAERDATVLRDGEVLRGEEVATANGVTRTLHATRSPLRAEDGSIVGVVGFARDVTSRKNEDVARVRDVLLILETNAMLQACRGLDEAYDVLGRLVPSFFPEVSGALALFHASRTVVEVRAAWPAPESGASSPRTFAPDDCWALRRGQPHEVSGANAPWCRHVEAAIGAQAHREPPSPMPETTLCLPLVAQGQVLGVLHLASPTVIEEDTHHRALLVGEQLSLSLANLELREVLRHQSLRDPLTGLFNRRYVEAALEQEVQRAARESQPFSVLMMDVDHFKRFNDTHGHEAGDEVLRAIARLLGQQIRGSDVASRIGGEELLVLLPGAGADGARKRADELRAAIALLEVAHLGADVGPVTISIGVATFPEHGERADALLRAADDALYRAKRAGRNRVVLAGDAQTQRALRVTRTS